MSVTQALTLASNTATCINVRLGQPLLDKCMEGFNGTVFAYGQTGSGKTFSMQGVQDHPDLKGLIPRFTVKLFERVSEEKVKDENKLFLVTCR